MKFTNKNRGIRNISSNHEGDVSFDASDKEQFVQIVTTSLFGEDKYYEDGNQIKEKIDILISDISLRDPEFPLMVANYCRNVLFMRTMPIYILVRCSNIISCKPYIRKYTKLIIKRVSDMIEIIACLQKYFGVEHTRNKDGKKFISARKIPNSIKKGICDCFVKFDEYQYAKWNRKGNVTLKDLIMLVHPKEPQHIIKKILDDTLETPMTVEATMNKVKNPYEAYRKVIVEKRLPYTAALKYLNAMAKSGLESNYIDMVLDYIKSPSAIEKAKVFPFEYYIAYKYNDWQDLFMKSKLKDTMNIAMLESLKYVHKLHGRTMIVSDASGSMTFGISKRSKMTHKEIANTMNAMASKICDDSISAVFASEFMVSNILSGSILHDIDYLNRMDVGSSTNGHKIFEYLSKNKVHLDRVIIFTDEELWNSNSFFSTGEFSAEVKKYIKNISPDVKIYIVNLNGYGHTCTEPSKNVYNVSGWNNNILKWIVYNEKEKKTFINEIISYNKDGK